MTAPHSGDRLAAPSPRASPRSSSGWTRTPPSSGRRPRRTPARLPRPPAPRSPVPRVARHCAAVIDAAGPACVAVKPQLACFERLGSAGWIALEETVAHAARRGPARPARRQARRRPGDRPRLRPGARRRHPLPLGRRARPAAATPSPSTRCSAATRWSRSWRRAAPRGAAPVRPGAHLEPGRRRPDGPRARRRRPPLGAARRARGRPRQRGRSPASTTSAPSPARRSPRTSTACAS